MTHPLTGLAATNLGDADARLAGFVAVSKSRDLYPLGIQIVYHVDPVAHRLAIEYRPRHIYEAKPGFYHDDDGWDGRLFGDKPAYRRVIAPGSAGIPRLVIYTYEEQCQVHRALGLHFVPRGCKWRPLPAGQGTLPFVEEREAA